MESGIVTALGGLGVFLVGMVIMTDGLKSLTGKTLRKTLARYIHSPYSGAVTGALSTAVIQSSSATTVTAVGFVGARILTFSQALGIIFGANIGTTITGWLVAVVGLKLKIGSLAMPLILVGILMNLFLKRRLAAVGLAIAGFGLIFVGVGLLQTGLIGLESWVTPERLPGNTLIGRMTLVLIGIAITLVTQSSSAGVATALAAVYGGSISFEQAAAMVVGMDVGTTATAALATVGGNTDVRRTGFAHVIYNMLTGLGAFLLITPYTWFLSSVYTGWFEENPELALVGFHTLFNLLGVIAVLPFTESFAKLIIWLVPQQTSPYTRRLDRSLFANPQIALDAVRHSLRELAQLVFGCTRTLLEKGPSDRIEQDFEEADHALKSVRDYINGIETERDHKSLFNQKLQAIHTIDHLRRLIDRCEESKNLQMLKVEPELAALGQQLLGGIESAIVTLAEEDPGAGQQTGESSPEQTWLHMESNAERNRAKLISHAASGQSTAQSTLYKLDAIRWIRRVSCHVWRITYHMIGRVNSTSAAFDQDSAELDDVGHVDEIKKQSH